MKMAKADATEIGSDGEPNSNPTIEEMQAHLERHLLWRRSESLGKPLATELRRIDRMWFLTWLGYALLLFIFGAVLISSFLLAIPFGLPGLTMAAFCWCLIFIFLPKS
jgi:hypothetical protein